MSIHHFSALLQPASVTLIGASRRSGSAGNLLARNLRSGGFKGELTTVNPKYDRVEELPCYASVADLPNTPELAVIVTPARHVAALIEQLAERGGRAAVVISTGFSGKQRQAMLDAARPYRLRILGPDSLGLLNPALGLNASLSHLPAPAGHIALLASSGTVMTTMLDWAADHAVGFSHLLALGSSADIDIADCLNYLAEDTDTQAILLYLEAITDSRKFLSAARAAARVKPLIVLKPGRFDDNDALYDAAFARAGLLRVNSIAELFDMAATLAHTPRLGGDRLAIVTNGAGMGRMAADALTAAGGRIAQFSAETLKQLGKRLPAAPSMAVSNPLDIGTDATPQRYADIVTLLQQAPDIDAVLVLHCPVAGISGVEVAGTLAGQAGAATSKRPLLTSWPGSHTAAAGRDILLQQSIPSYDSPSEAVHAFMQLVCYRRNQALLMETPASLPTQFESEPAAAASIIAHAVSEKRTRLNPREVLALCDAYAIPIVTTYFAADADEAAQLAAMLNQPVALKIACDDDIAHAGGAGAADSDTGVVLNVSGRRQVRLAALGLQADITARFPQAHLQGFSIQPMVHWPQACELKLGMHSDALFGPVLTFGHGGAGGALIDDHTIALPPLNSKLARQLINGTRVAKLLQNQADYDAVLLTLIKLSQLISDQPYIAAIDIDPLVVTGQDVLALDVRIKISSEVAAGPQRLAIKPYPQELEQEIRAPDNGDLFILRPIRAEDEPALIRAFQKLDPQEIRLRFHHPLKMEHRLAARLTQIDYDREMALILTDRGGRNHIYGVVRMNADSDRRRAEFAIIVARHYTGRGLGRLMLRRLIDYARSQNIGEIYGSVLQENDAMLGLCRKLGFSIGDNPAEPGTLLVTLKLLDN